MLAGPKFTVTGVVELRCGVLGLTVPPLMVTTPVNVLLPVSASTPLPDLVSETARLRPVLKRCRENIDCRSIHGQRGRYQARVLNCRGRRGELRRCQR